MWFLAVMASAANGLLGIGGPPMPIPILGSGPPRLPSIGGTGPGNPPTGAKSKIKFQSLSVFRKLSKCMDIVMTLVTYKINNSV